MPKASLGGIVSGVRGRLGDEVATRGRSGTILRRRPTYRYPVKPSQLAVQERMKQATAAWNTLTREQAAAWNAYARTRPRHNTVDGTTYYATGFNAFSGLAMKFLQIHPAGEVPLTPPATSFAGEGLLLTLTGEAGQIVFTASGPNSPDVQTELLLQPLKNARRAPTAFYKSQAFVAFVTDALRHALPVPPGHYAGAYRFVQAQTGQETLLFPLNVVQVS